MSSQVTCFFSVTRSTKSPVRCIPQLRVTPSPYRMAVDVSEGGFELLEVFATN